MNRLIALWTVAIFAVASACITHLVIRFETVRLGYEVSKERREQRRLMEVRHVLHLESSVLRDSHRVHTIATTQLGMQAPSLDQIKNIGRGRRHVD